MKLINKKILGLMMSISFISLACAMEDVSSSDPNHSTFKLVSPTEQYGQIISVKNTTVEDKRKNVILKIAQGKEATLEENQLFENMINEAVPKDPSIPGDKNYWEVLPRLLITQKIFPLLTNKEISRFTQCSKKLNRRFSVQPIPLINKITTYLTSKEIGLLRQCNKTLHHQLTQLYIRKMFVENFSQWLRDPNKLFVHSKYSALSIGVININDLILGFGKTNGEIVKGCLFIYQGLYEKGLSLLKDKQLPESLQNRINEAALKYELDFTGETRKKHLEEQAKKGDKNAQSHLNFFATHGCLGFTIESGKKYLEKRVKEYKDQDAQQCLNQAAKYGYLGFTKKNGKEYLEERLKKGDKYAEKLRYIDENKDYLDFKNMTTTEMKKLIENNNKDARDFLNEDALYCRGEFTKETGKKHLEEQAKKGDENAQNHLNFAAKNCLLDFTEETGNEYLKSQVKKGDENARDYLYGIIGSVMLERSYRKKKAKKGDLKAQQSLYKGHDSREDRYYFFFAYNFIRGFEEFLPTKDGKEIVFEESQEKLRKQLKIIGIQNPTFKEIKAANHILITLKLSLTTLEQIKKVVFARSLGLFKPSLKELKSINSFTIENQRSPKSKQEVMDFMEPKEQKLTINSVEGRKNLHNQLKIIGIQNPKPEEIKAANHILNTLKLTSLTPEQIKKVVFARSLGFLEPSINVLKAINNFINIHKRAPFNKKEIMEAMEKNK